MESSSPASIQTNISAQTGGTTNSPVIDGNHVQGSLIVNINNLYGGPEASSSGGSTVLTGSSPSASALTGELLCECKQNHKSILKKKYKNISEGISQHGTSTLLNEIYTELYITEGGSGEVNNEHEVRRIEAASKKQATQETPINVNDIFKSLPGKDKDIRTVLTRGIAGIGKTVSVQKFILDWAERKANQNVDFVFPFPFRELNLIKKRKLSLIKLLHLVFPQTERIQSTDCASSNVIFIFDGLDECRLPLDFQNNESLFDVTESASIDVLLTNLIKGNLLPSALIWVTSRPAAANLIPPVDQVTEVRGFSDPQKEEYFRKRVGHPSLAEKITNHIRISRSLYIMCHIPVFCWIAATVLEGMLNNELSGDIPKTLTQMFTQFLIFQIKHKGLKYHGKSDIDYEQTRKIIVALGKLAFQQLEKGHLIFYEQDLKKSGIDVKEISVYSGVCTQIFREEFGLYLEKVYSFVHLSVQEFLSALFAFLSFISDNRNVLVEQSTPLSFSFFKKLKMSDFLRCAVDKALESENGHLDLFLRFLLGLSLESNQTRLRSLLPQIGNISYNKEETVEYIKKKIRENPSPEKTINLFHCLNELNDDSLVQEVQKYLSRKGDDRIHRDKLSPAQWSAVAFVLLNSEEELDEFDLSKYEPSEECLLRLLPVVKASRKVVLCGCNLTKDSCSVLASALSSNLRVLDLSSNELQDSGVKQLSEGLEIKKCNLETLRLCKCSITEEGCVALVKVLKSNPSHLRELDLNYNNPGDVGMKELSDLLKDPQCKLEKLQLSGCCVTEKSCAYLVNALELNPSSHLKEMYLNYSQPGESGLKLLSAVNSKLEKLQLCSCNLTENSCAVLPSALSSNSASLRELKLNYNDLLQDSGVKLLSAGLENSNCKLETLGLEGCSITEEGCAALVKALKSNPSHLKDLNLSNNKLGESAVMELCDLLQDPQCKVEKLQLCKCYLTEENCEALASVLSFNSSHLRELNLSYNELQDSGVKKLSVGLGNTHCKLEKLILCNCSIKEEGCVALVKALKSNPSYMGELNLSYNNLGYSGEKGLSDLLEDSCCKLEKLHIAPPQNRTRMSIIDMPL